MNDHIRDLTKLAGGEFWQRIESDGVLNKEAYITFDPPQSLEKFAEMIVRECARIANEKEENFPQYDADVSVHWYILKHFGLEK